MKFSVVLHKLIVLFLAFFFITGCQIDRGINPDRKPDFEYNPFILEENFQQSTKVDNPYMPLNNNATYIYEGETEDGIERVELTSVDESKVILGIPCITVHEIVMQNGVRSEESRFWLAQDNDGNVWHMGEVVDRYNASGHLINHHGSWEAGVSGAKPGIAMLANVHAGQSYRKEYYFNFAEDKAEVVEMGIKAETPAGVYENCIKIKEWSELERGLFDYKIYAPDIGLIKETSSSENDVLQLIEIK